MRATLLALAVLLAGCVDVDRYTPLSQLRFLPLALLVPVPFTENDRSTETLDAFALADIDGDGAEDLIYSTIDKSLVVQRAGARPGTFFRAAERSTDVAEVRGYASHDLLAFELDRGGSVGIAAPGLEAWRWDSGASRPVRLAAFPMGINDDAHGVIADTDGDGQPEVWYGSVNGMLQIDRWDGAHFLPLATAEGGAGADSTIFQAVDVDGDGRQDVLAYSAAIGAADPKVFWGGTTPWATGTAVDCGTKRSASMLVADLDGDGHADLIANDNASQLQWCRGLGGRAFAPATPLAEVTGRSLLGAADFDRDRRPDMFVQDSPNDQSFTTLHTLHNAEGQRMEDLPGDVTLPLVTKFAYPRQPRVVAIDLDHDGLVDLAIWNGDGLSWLKNASR